MSKNQDLGIASSSVGTASGTTGAAFGLYVEMVPLSAASMENGRAGLLLRVNAGGSTRRKGELEVRRFERRPTRLCLGEPRLRLIGVELVVLGEDKALRTEGIDDGVVTVRSEENIEGLDLVEADVVQRNAEGFARPSAVFERLVGELKMAGSMFSESYSS